ncbi:MAG: type VI secretion system protein TssA [Candidatus Eisenbacteria bacterium]
MSEATLELGRKPVSDAAPTGASCRDDVAFEALQGEFQKLERPDAGAPDWYAAEKSATDLLANKSKDVLVGAYLAIALFEREGYAGFADGLTMVREICATWWDTLFPERPRGRQAAMQFIGDRGARRVALRGTEGASRDGVERVLAAVDELDTLVSEKLEGASGMFSELRRELNGVLENLAPAEPEAPPPPPPSSESSSFATPAPVSSGPSVPSSIANAEEWDAAANLIKPLLRQMAEFRRMADPKDPLAYRLVRVAAWLTIKQSPPSNGGATSIPPPQPAEFAAQVEAKLAAQAWAGVVEDTEGRLHMSVFWLDPHFWAWSALKGMGNAHAAEAVASEVRALLQRCPDLPTLAFATGMPLANDACKSWIKDVVLAGPGAAAGAGAKPASSAPTEVAPETATFAGLAEAKSQAAELAAAGQVGDAVRLLEAGAARATRARERAAWKIAVAEACADAGRPDVALAQLEALQDELQATRLEMWDPELSAQLLRLLLWARQKALPPTQMNAEEHQRSRELLKKLARLDAAAALDYARPAQG